MTPESLSQAIKEFKEIYKEEYSIELSDEEATKKAQSLLQFFSCLTIEDKRRIL